MRKKEIKFALRPEHDFLTNSAYLNNLVKRINKLNDFTNLDKDFLQEILQADYYINKLIRYSSSDNSFDVESLKGMSAVFQGALDFVESKEILSLHEDDNSVSKSYDLDYDYDYPEFFLILKRVFIISLFLFFVTAIWQLLNGGTLRLVYNIIVENSNSILGILLTITRYIGMAMAIFGMCEMVMSFTQDMPDKRVKGVTLALVGVVMIVML